MSNMASLVHPRTSAVLTRCLELVLQTAPLVNPLWSGALLGDGNATASDVADSMQTSMLVPRVAHYLW